MNVDAPAAARPNRSWRVARRVLAGVGVGGLVAGTLAAAPAASAATWTGRDPAGDVVRWSWSPEPEPCGTYEEHVVDEAGVDLRRFTVSHQVGEVQLRVRVGSLRHREDHLDFAVRVPGGRRHFQVAVARGLTGTIEDASLIRLPRRVEPNECGEFGFVSESLCDGRVDADLDYRRDMVTVTVPRSCLGRPRWVRAAASLGSWIDGTGSQDAWTAPDGSRFSPRIRAGAPRGSRGTEPPHRAG